MPHSIRAIDQRLERIERFLAVAFYLLLIAAIAANVFARDVLHAGSALVLEKSPMLVLWLALAGASLGWRHRRHITIGLLQRMLPAQWRRPADIAVNLFAMVVSAVLGYAAVAFVRGEVDLFGPWGWGALCFPIFFLLIFFRSAFRLAARPRTSQNGGR